MTSPEPHPAAHDAGLDELAVSAPPQGRVDAPRPGSGPAAALARAGAPPDALRDLVLAVGTSARALDGVRALQAELVAALKRQDRSELVLQSTQALNDTFRNLTAVQRELLERLDRTESKGPGRLVPLMLIGLLIAFLAGTWLVAAVLEQLRVDREDPVRVVQEATERALAAYREGLDEKDEGQVRELERFAEQVRQLQEREQVLRGRLDEEGSANADLLKQVRGLEAEREGLAQQILTARNEVLARRALETEVQESIGRIAVLEPRLADLESRLAQEREDNTALRKRLAALGLGLPDPAEAGEAPGALPEGAAPAPGTPAPAPPRVEPAGRVDRDPVLLEKIRDRLNTILDQGSRPQTSLWQVTRIDGVTPEGLVGVIALRYDRASGRLLAQVTARAASFEVLRSQRVVEVEFKDGALKDADGTKALPATGWRQRVAEGEMQRLWTQSGLLFVQALP